MNRSIVAIAVLTLMSSAAVAGDHAENRQDRVRRDLPVTVEKHPDGSITALRVIGFRHNGLDLIERLAVELELGRRIVGARPGRWRQRVEFVLDGRRPGFDQREHRHGQRLHHLDIVAIAKGFHR